MRVGVTGHVKLTAFSIPFVYLALIQVLRRFPAVHGVTCLAAGSDQLFARAVRATRGTYEVILPARDYVSLHGRRMRRASRLLDDASGVSCAPFDKSDEAAYLAASEELLRRCDHLLAVWDGNPSGLPGGTAHTVAKARRLGIPVTVVWPTGASRR
jgi:hypothetical protein